MKSTSVSKGSKHTSHFQSMEDNGVDVPMDDDTDPHIDVLPQVNPTVQQTPLWSGAQTPAQLASALRNRTEPSQGDTFPHDPS